MEQFSNYLYSVYNITMVKSSRKRKQRGGDEESHTALKAAEAAAGVPSDSHAALKAAEAAGGKRRTRKGKKSKKRSAKKSRKNCRKSAKRSRR